MRREGRRGALWEDGHVQPITRETMDVQAALSRNFCDFFEVLFFLSNFDLSEYRYPKNNVKKSLNFVNKEETDFRRQH